ncbi:ABC transporter permease [Streptacidiphilus cavernicola]|uniref:ABC transporter permease n=1 Tax=Streptacidiphilus cavernicola TaxID=3342716 RepID=A0ABV6W232_9ACTN
MAVCVTAFTISGSAQRAAHDRVQEGSANRSITVQRMIDRPDSKLLGAAAVAQFAAIPGVSSVQPSTQVSFGYKSAQIPGVLLYATMVRPSLLPPVTRSVRTKLFPLRTGEVVLPSSSQGMNLSQLLGQSITVSTTLRTSRNSGTGTTAKVRVVGLFDPSWQIDGPDAAYAADTTVVDWAAALEGVSPQQFPSTIGYSQVTILATSADDVPAVLHTVQQDGYGATTLQQEMTALPGVLDLIRVVGQVLIVVLGLIALVGALVVSGALSRQRVREIGILKAVGFRSRVVLTMLVLEMAIVAAAGAIVGTVLGTGGAAVAVAALRGQSNLTAFLPSSTPLPSAAVLGGLILLTLGITVAGAWLPARRAAGLAPSSAMNEW